MAGHRYICFCLMAGAQNWTFYRQDTVEVRQVTYSWKLIEMELGVILMDTYSREK